MKKEDSPSRINGDIVPIHMELRAGARVEPSQAESSKAPPGRSLTGWTGRAPGAALRLVALFLLPAFAASACGESGTGGEAIRFSLAAESLAAGDAAVPRVFTTRSGWEVQLEEARIAVGPLYLFTNPPPSASLLPLHERLLGWIVPRALAHSGFDKFDGGEVKGEYLGQFVIDALQQGLQPIAELDGIAGPVRSVTLSLDPPRDGAAGLHGHHAWVRGSATREEQTIRFEGGLDLPDEGTVRKVVGIPAEVELAEGELVVLELRVERWFAEADFSTLQGEGEDVRPIDPASQVRAAWLLGARGFGTFSIR